MFLIWHGHEGGGGYWFFVCLCVWEYGYVDDDDDDGSVFTFSSCDDMQRWFRGSEGQRWTCFGMNRLSRGSLARVSRAPVSEAA